MDKKDIISLIESLGLAYSAQFVPQSQSRNKGKEPSLNWIVTISMGQRNELQTDYMQGIGNLQNYNFAESKKLWYSENVKHACESGAWNKNLTYETQFSNSILRKPYWKPIPAPELIDVLFSLMLNSDVIEYSNFEEWADNCGYDKDSRSAEATYKACLEIALKLRSILGESALAQLREAYQDY